MAYELTGKIKLIQDEQAFKSGFRKREVVVTVDDGGKYPQDICLEFVQDKADLLNDYSPGQAVTITFDLRGREYNGRYYNNLNGWRISAASDDAPPPPADDEPPPDFADDVPF